MSLDCNLHLFYWLLISHLLRLKDIFGIEIPTIKNRELRNKWLWVINTWITFNTNKNYMDSRLKLKSIFDWDLR